MAPISLADSSITSATPGVLVKGTVDPNVLSGTIVVGNHLPEATISDQIDSSYIVGGANAFLTFLWLQNTGTMFFRLGETVDSPGQGSGPGPQFTEDAEDNIWIVLFYGATSAAWDFSELDDSDETEPYVFSAASVTAAGPTNDAALRTAINADSTVIAMLVDSSVDGIDIANLTYDDTPPALEVGATATLPSLTATGGAELVDPLLLSDFDDTGLETEALALFEAERTGTNSYVWSRTPHTQGNRGTLVDGEMDVANNNPLNAIRFRATGSGNLGNGRISLEENDGSFHLRNYLQTGDGSDLTLHIQSESLSFSFGVNTHGAAGGDDWARWELTASAEQAVLASIGDGDRFIFALTRIPALEVGGTVTLPSLTAEGGVELTDPADLEVGATATLPALTATGGVELIDPAPVEVGGTATLPGLTATGGVELSSIAPLTVGGAATLPGLTGAGGVSLSDVPPLNVGAVATLPGLTGTGGAELTDAAPLEVGAIATLPGLTATGGVELTDAAALEVGAAATLPGVTGVGGVQLTSPTGLSVGGAATLPSMTGAAGVAFVSGVVQPAISDQNARVGQPFTFCPPAATGGFEPLAYAARACQAASTFTRGTGLVYGVPGATGTSTVTFTVTDDMGNASSQSFDIVVGDALQPKDERPFPFGELTAADDGIAWAATTNTSGSNNSVFVVRYDTTGQIATEQIDTQYIESGADAYVNILNLTTANIVQRTRRILSS